jgi:hypothetical protein
VPGAEFFFSDVRSCHYKKIQDRKRHTCSQSASGKANDFIRRNNHRSLDAEPPKENARVEPRNEEPSRTAALGLHKLFLRRAVAKAIQGCCCCDAERSGMVRRCRWIVHMMYTSAYSVACVGRTQDGIGGACTLTHIANPTPEFSVALEKYVCGSQSPSSHREPQP